MAQIGTIRVDTQNNGTVSVPVFDTGDSGSSIYEFVRVQTGSGTGFIPVEDTSNATYPYLRVHSQSHGTVAMTDRSAAIPDSVVSRTDDDSSAELFSPDSRGLVVNPNSDFNKFGVRISKKTSGVTRARLYDYSQGAYVETIDISGLSAGDAFTFNSGVVAGTDYGVEVGNSGSSYTIGFYGGKGWPFTGEDFDIIAQSRAGNQSTSVTPQGVNDIGKSGL